MFNVGGGELIVIALIALIVLGPQRLPGAARQVGKTMGDLRRLSSGFQAELRSAIDDADRTASPGKPASPATVPEASVVAAIDAVSSQAIPEGATTSSTRKASAKPAPAKRTAAKKAPAKNAPTRKTVAKKAPAKKTVAKKAAKKAATPRKASGVAAGGRRRSPG